MKGNQGVEERKRKTQHGGARPGSGRPPLGDKAMIGQSVYISMPKENWDLLRSYLKNNHMDMAVYFRDLAMNDMMFNEDFHK